MARPRLLQDSPGQAQGDFTLHLSQLSQPHQIADFLEINLDHQFHHFLSSFSFQVLESCCLKRFPLRMLSLENKILLDPTFSGKFENVQVEIFGCPFIIRQNFDNSLNDRHLSPLSSRIEVIIHIFVYQLVCGRWV